MADIGVERKRPRVWPWIIGLLVLALLVWVVLELFGGNDDRMETRVIPDPAARLQRLRTPPVTEPTPTMMVLTVNEANLEIAGRHGGM